MVCDSSPGRPCVLINYPASVPLAVIRPDHNLTGDPENYLGDKRALDVITERDLHCVCMVVTWRDRGQSGGRWCWTPEPRSTWASSSAPAPQLVLTILPGN